MGCYVMEPGVFNYIPKNKSYGMDDVVRKAILKKKLVNSFGKNVVYGWSLVPKPPAKITAFTK